MAIAFIYGTTAELIKLAPVMRELQARHVPFESWCTAQHVSNITELCETLEVPAPALYFVAENKREHVARAAQVPSWATRVMVTAHRLRHRLKRWIRHDGMPVVIVHGDTFTTVLGALIGRMIGAKVAHIEAGMRTGNWRSPFPEELNRIIAARLTRFHYAPTEDQAKNLRREKVGGEIVLTGANTAIDALRESLHQAGNELGVEPGFGLVTLHRFELVRDREAFKAVLQCLADYAQHQRLVMVIGESEEAVMKEINFDASSVPLLQIIPKCPHQVFLELVRDCDFVVTDSGGLQIECAYLGLPAAIHRLTVEQRDRVGENLLLTKLDIDVLRDFLNGGWRTMSRESQLDMFHPSQVAAEHLEKLQRGAA